MRLVFLSKLASAFRAAILACLIGAVSYDAAAASGRIPLEKLEPQLVSRLDRVEEFRFLREACEKLRLRCWLFGGTSASYAHYVRWDLLREAGETRYQPERFDYDFSNIFRSTQDVDIVVDGDVEQAVVLERLLDERFPNFRGNRELWEVRLLSQQRGTKEPLLDNPGFLNQHTDSNSTGLIEVTQPPDGSRHVRDVLDWQGTRKGDSRFLRDVSEGRLHYYYSKLHHTTPRARAGLNPPIISAIRALTKVFQSELELDDESRRNIQQVIREFDPARDLRESYVRGWLEKNAPKMYQNAVNLEDAKRTMDELGLRRKLIDLGDPQSAGTMAHWLNKDPLPSFKVGEGSGRTAREIFASSPAAELTPQGELIVAHDTSDMLAYESIARSPAGEPNVFQSRQGMPGEAAVHGNGFYVALGREGHHRNGFALRFAVHPGAREGADFFRPPGQDVLVFRNRKAFRLIPESLDLDPAAYFRILLNPENLERRNSALFYREGRRIRNRLAGLSQAQIGGILDVIREKVMKGSGSLPEPIWKDLLFSPAFVGHPKFAQTAEAIRGSKWDGRRYQRAIFELLGKDPVLVDRHFDALVAPDHLRKLLLDPAEYHFLNEDFLKVLDGPALSGYWATPENRAGRSFAFLKDLAAQFLEGAGGEQGSAHQEMFEKIVQHRSFDAFLGSGEGKGWAAGLLARYPAQERLPLALWESSAISEAQRERVLARLAESPPDPKLFELWIRTRAAERHPHLLLHYLREGVGSHYYRDAILELLKRPELIRAIGPETFAGFVDRVAIAAATGGTVDGKPLFANDHQPWWDNGPSMSERFLKELGKSLAENAPGLFPMLPSVSEGARTGRMSAAVKAFAEYDVLDSALPPVRQSLLELGQGLVKAGRADAGLRDWLRIIGAKKSLVKGAEFSEVLYQAFQVVAQDPELLDLSNWKGGLTDEFLRMLEVHPEWVNKPDIHRVVDAALLRLDNGTRNEIADALARGPLASHPKAANWRRAMRANNLEQRTRILSSWKTFHGCVLDRVGMWLKLTY